MPEPTAHVRTLPELPSSVILFVTNYYDGPLEGLVTLPDGALGYFKLTDDSAWNDRTLAVYPLTGDEAARERTAKTLFEEHVGTHWSSDRPAAERAVRPGHDFAAYDEALADAGLGRAREDTYDDRPAIAWIAA